MSLAGDGGDCQTVVSQVCRRDAALLNCHSQFVLDSLADWKQPVKVTKPRRDVVELFCSRHDAAF